MDYDAVSATCSSCREHVAGIQASDIHANESSVSPLQTVYTGALWRQMFRKEDTFQYGTLRHSLLNKL